MWGVERREMLSQDRETDTQKSLWLVGGLVGTHFTVMPGLWICNNNEEQRVRASA